VSGPKYVKVLLAASQKLPQVLKRRRIEKQKSVLSDKEVLELVTSNR